MSATTLIGVLALATLLIGFWFGATNLRGVRKAKARGDASRLGDRARDAQDASLAGRRD